MRKYAVIGMGYGDEGKGLVTDYLCSKLNIELVTRYSGGQQAGHTVVFEDKRHVFSNFGSGSFRGVPTYWSPNCTVDPVGIMRELAILKKMGVNPTLYIDADCMVTTPYDKHKNKELHYQKAHGTCGVGVGTTIDREESHYRLHAMDLSYDFVLRNKLKMIADYYESNKIEDAESFFTAVHDMLASEHVSIVHGKSLSFAGCEVYEGSQGLMLDPKIGFFPHVTRTRTGMAGIVELGIPASEITAVLVTRAYSTRHGNGPFQNEDIPNNIKVDEKETNVSNSFQGPFRRAILDLDILKYAMESDKTLDDAHDKILVVTCLDHIENEYRYVQNGKIVYLNNEHDFLSGMSSFLGIEHVYSSHGPTSSDIKKELV